MATGRSSLALGALLGTLALSWPDFAWAQGCAMCGTAVGDDPVGRAISWSVIFMMAMPYTVVGTIGAWLYFTYRRAGRRAAAIDLTALRPAPAAEGRGGDLA